MFLRSAHIFIQKRFVFAQGEVFSIEGSVSMFFHAPNDEHWVVSKLDLLMQEADASIHGHLETYSLFVTCIIISLEYLGV